MEHLISLTESQAGASHTAIIDETKFVKCMREQPIWEFASLSRSDYLKLNTKEKSSLINQYYIHMLSLEKGGKFILFSFSLDLQKCHAYQIHIFVFSRKEIELEFEKILNETKKCNQCGLCFACHRAELNDFELERKCFYTSNKNIDSWKKRYQGRFKRLVISPVFNY